MFNALVSYLEINKKYFVENVFSKNMIELVRVYWAGRQADRQTDRQINENFFL